MTPEVFYISHSIHLFSCCRRKKPTLSWWSAWARPAWRSSTWSLSGPHPRCEWLFFPVLGTVTTFPTLIVLLASHQPVQDGYNQLKAFPANCNRINLPTEKFWYCLEPNLGLLGPKALMAPCAMLFPWLNIVMPDGQAAFHLLLAFHFEIT